MVRVDDLRFVRAACVRDLAPKPNLRKRIEAFIQPHCCDGGITPFETFWLHRQPYGNLESSHRGESDRSAEEILNRSRFSESFIQRVRPFTESGKVGFMQ